MNNIEIIFNCISCINNKNRERGNTIWENMETILWENMETVLLFEIEPSDIIELCRGSLILTFHLDNQSITQYEVVESDPLMEPKELYNIWRLFYE